MVRRSLYKSLVIIQEKLFLPPSNTPWTFFNSLDHVSAGSALPGNLLVGEGGHPGAEAAVVGVIVTTLFLGFFQQPCSVPSQGLVPSRNIILRENEELDDEAPT